MRKNYILIDYENKPLKDLSALSNECFHVKILLGARNEKLPVELVLSGQALANQPVFIKTNGMGKNALDLHLALLLGELVNHDPKAFFHILSADKDFDTLIDRLKERKISIRRIECIEDIDLLKEKPVPTTLADRVAVALVRLKSGQSRPAQLKTLCNSLHSLFGKTLPDADIEKIVAELKARKILSIKENKVIYADRPAPAAIP